MKALIFGITGQDGSYLSELLLAKGYDVYGVRRWTSVPTTFRIDHIKDQIKLIPGDITDASFVHHVVKDVAPDEIYNLASISTTHYQSAEAIVEVNGVGPITIFDAAMSMPVRPRVFQASSAEILGLRESPQGENTLHWPTNIYGAAKLLAHNVAQVYRDKGLFVSCGILFNHESPRRTEEFVSRKITASVARIIAGKQKKLELWDLNASKDWGYAADYVQAMWLILQNDGATDYCIGTGVAHTVKDFVKLAFERAGIADWENYVEHNSKPPSKYRPVPCADIQKINLCLKWRANTTFGQLVAMMMDADLKSLENLPVVKTTSA